MKIIKYNSIDIRKNDMTIVVNITPYRIPNCFGGNPNYRNHTMPVNLQYADQVGMLEELV